MHKVHFQHFTANVIALTAFLVAVPNAEADIPAACKTLAGKPGLYLYTSGSTALRLGATTRGGTYSDDNRLIVVMESQGGEVEEVMHLRLSTTVRSSDSQAPSQVRLVRNDVNSKCKRVPKDFEGKFPVEASDYDAYRYKSAKNGKAILGQWHFQWLAGKNGTKNDCQETANHIPGLRKKALDAAAAKISSATNTVGTPLARANENEEIAPSVPARHAKMVLVHRAVGSEVCFNVRFNHIKNFDPQHTVIESMILGKEKNFVARRRVKIVWTQ